MAKSKIDRPQLKMEAKPIVPKDGMNVPYLCQKDLLCVLGSADPTRHMAPYDDDNFEFWACAVCSTYPDVKRIDVQFEMHTEAYWENNEDVLKRLRKQTVPIYMQKKYKQIPNSMPYPIDIINQYAKYNTSTISYMLAMAYHSYLMTEKPKHVALFGIMMQADEEYGEQRPCCEYWLGRMEDAGIDIMINPGAAILGSPGLYGYENYTPFAYDIRQRIVGLTAGIGKAKEEFERWKIQVAKNEGGLAENEYWLQRIQKGEFK